MSKQSQPPSAPYEVGYAKPPKQSRFKKGLSGNPYGRPRKRPDFHTELTRVLRETVTITNEGEPERVTVQQALLLRLRAEALRGEVWAGKQVHKLIDAIPDHRDEYDQIEREVFEYRLKALLMLMLEEMKSAKADENAETMEAGDGA